MPKHWFTMDRGGKGPFFKKSHTICSYVVAGFRTAAPRNIPNIYKKYPSVKSVNEKHLGSQEIVHQQHNIYGEIPSTNKKDIGHVHDFLTKYLLAIGFNPSEKTISIGRIGPFPTQKTRNKKAWNFIPPTLSCRSHVSVTRSVRPPVVVEYRLPRRFQIKAMDMVHHVEDTSYTSGFFCDTPWKTNGWNTDPWRFGRWISSYVLGSMWIFPGYSPWLNFAGYRNNDLGSLFDG